MQPITFKSPLTINKTTLALAMGSLFTSHIVIAQDAPFTFDQVVVSATKSEQDIKDITSSVASINADDINQSMSSDLKQAVQSQPGVSVSGQGRFGLSGFNIRGRDNNYVKVVVDNVQQSGIYNPGADVMRKNQNTIETDTLQSIEINKGPISSLYGSDALGGAVIMRTKNPSDLLGEGDDSYSSIKTGYASVDESFKTTATMANRSGPWESLFMFTYRDGHEAKTHGSGSDIDGRDRGQADPFDIKSNNFLGKVFYQADEDNRIGFTIEYFNRDAKGDIKSNDGYTIMPGFTYTQNSAADNDERIRLSLEHEWQANINVFDTLDWQISWQTSKSDHNTYDHTNSNGYRNRERNGEDDNYQAQATFNKAFSLNNSDHDLVYGATYVHNEFNLDYTNHFYSNGSSTDTTPEVPNARSENIGVFIQDQGFYLNDQLIVNLGVRYDVFKSEPMGTTKYEKTDDDAITGKIGSVYHFTDNTSAFAQISQGFKAPTLYDLYYEYSMGATILPNPDLKAEESTAYETGLRYHNQFGRFEITAFYNDYHNFIDQKYIGQDSSTGNDVYQNQNIAESRIYGAEFASQIALSSLADSLTGAYVQANVAYAQGEDTQTNEAIDSVAPLTSYIAIGFDSINKDFGGKLSVQMAASKEGDDWSSEDNLTTPGYAVTDITTYYRPSRDLTLRAGLFNAFDKKYWLYTNVSGVSKDEGFDRRSEPGRNWGVEMEYEF